MRSVDDGLRHLLGSDRRHVLRHERQNRAPPPKKKGVEDSLQWPSLNPDPNRVCHRRLLDALRYTPEHLDPAQRGLCKLGHARAELPSRARPSWRVFRFAAGAARANAYPACPKRVRLAG